MDLSEFFLNLSVGELQNLAMAQTGDATGIDPLKHAGLVLYTNEALGRLFSRFLLREGQLVLEEVEGRTTYPLSSVYAMSNYDAAVKHPFYIQDQWGQPFEDDLVKVLEVWDSFGRHLPLNDPDAISSVFTPQPQVLQVPHPNSGVALAINYQAGHPKLTWNVETFDLTQKIDLPATLMTALSAYVAHKVYSNIGTQESTIKSAEHLKMFEMICVECVEYDLIGTRPSGSATRFNARGWI